MHPQVKRRTALIAIAAVLLGLGVVAMSQDRKEPRLKSHLTVYVSEPLLSRGGTVVVGAIEIPREDWIALAGPNIADDDPQNQKRATLNENDRLFGALAYGPVTLIELYYPEDGTFGVNFVPDIKAQDPPRLATEQILVGSGFWYDEQTDQRRHWETAMTFYVDGSRADRRNSRLVAASRGRIMNKTSQRQTFAGGIIYTPNNAEILEGTLGEYE